MLEKQTIDAVRESWRFARRGHKDLAKRFYERLFRAAPGVRPLFPDDLRAQRRKLDDMLETLVHGLACINTVMIELSALGQRHAEYNAEPEHYPVVRDTLIATLREAVGDRFTAEHERAWEETLNLVADVMIGAQHAVST